MNYVYDILSNFNQELYDFYDWDKNDNFTLIFPWHSNHCRNIPVRTVLTPLLRDFRVFSGNFAAAKSIPLQICLKYHPCLRLTLQSRRQIESNKSPLPCWLCALALNIENPRFARTGGLCSSLRPESSGRGWVLWSFGFAGHAASGGRAMPSSSQVVSAKW